MRGDRRCYSLGMTGPRTITTLRSKTSRVGGSPGAGSRRAWRGSRRSLRAAAPRSRRPKTDRVYEGDPAVGRTHRRLAQLNRADIKRALQSAKSRIADESALSTAALAVAVQALRRLKPGSVTSIPAVIG